MKPPSSARVVKPYPITPNSGILNVLGSNLLELLWDVVVGRTEDMMVREPALLVTAGDVALETWTWTVTMRAMLSIPNLQTNYSRYVRDIQVF